MSSTIWKKNGGVYLGFATSSTEFPPKDLQEKPIQFVGDRHILLLGPNGSGKSRRLLLPNLINLVNWSMLVIDIKGELASWSAEHRRKAGNEIVFLNPFKTLNLPSSGFNPVAALDPESEDFVDDALGLAEAIIRPEGRDPHWGASAQDLVSSLIMYSRLTGPGGGSLGHVRELLCKPSVAFVEIVKEMMKLGIELDHEEMALKAARFRDLSPENRELISIMSTAMTQTRWLDSRPVKADLARGSFDFGVMKEGPHPTTVYLILPANRLGTHSPWLRLMITAVLQKLMKDIRPAKVPVMLMLDEAAQLHDPPAIRNAMTMMRGYGIKLFSVFQDLPQARSVLGDRFESYVANAGVLQSFQAQDVKTASFLSQRSGERNADTLSFSSPVDDLNGGGGRSSGSMSFGLNKLPGILPQTIINMDEGFTILFSHKTKGVVRAYLPDPSSMAGFEHIANRQLA